MFRRPALLPLLFLPVLFLACTPPEPPISASEALAFAKRIEISIIQHNPGLLDNIFDKQWMSMQISAAAGNALKASSVASAVQELPKVRLGQKIVSNLGKDGFYSLVRQYEKDRRQHLLFRFYADGRTNYHDFELVKVDDQIKAIDVYIYETGENFSQTVADLLLLAESNNPAATAFDKEKGQLINNIRQLIDQKQFESARICYDSLPADYKRLKVFQLYHITISSHFGDSLHVRSLLEYQTLFPKDPSMFLMMISAYTLQRQYPKALAAIDKLDSVLGKDPFQDYYRGQIYSQLKDTARAIACFENVHACIPSFRKDAFVLLVSYMQAGDLDKAVRFTRQSQADSTFKAANLEAIYQSYPELKKKMQ